jgi:hypothetical protein
MSFNPDETVTIAALGGTLVFSYIGTATRKEPLTIKPLIATFVAGALLLGVGMWSGELAAMFAILLLITSMALNGRAVFDSITKLTT